MSAEAASETYEFYRQRQASLHVAAPSLEGYEIIAFLGEGTYGDVWHARHVETGTFVAIKRLRKQPDAKARVEVQMLAGLGAVRGIVALKQIHLDSEPYCYAMEFMEGGTLAGLLAQRKTLAFGEAWRIFTELTEALCYLHQHGAVHCDIKPENVLLDAAGNPRLSDFGQARGQGPRGSSLGTRYYMPPEQARLDVPDPRWDVYALGAILYQLLTGKKPRHDEEADSGHSTKSQSGSEARDRLERYAEGLEQAPPLQEHRKVPGVDRAAEELIERCLALDPAGRPKDALALQKLIARRERKRRQQPLIVFGGLAPAATLLIAGLLVVLGGLSALMRLEEQWVERTIDDNQTLATAIAAATKVRLDEQIQGVQREVLQPDAPGESNHWFQLLQQRSENQEAFQKAVEGQAQKTFLAHELKVDRWSVAGADGKVICNYGKLPGKSETSFDRGMLEQNFAWRGWYNGVMDLPKDQRRTNAADAARLLAERPDDIFLSQPYLRRGTHMFWVLTISGRVRPADNSPPLGVVSAQFDYEQFNWFIEHFETSTAHQKRKVVIANKLGQVIYHPALNHYIDARNSAASAPNSSEEPIDVPRLDPAHKEHRFFVEEPFAQTAKSGPEARLPEGPPRAYADPWYGGADQQQYYVGRAVTILDNGQPLAVFVMHNTDTAMQGFVQIRNLAQLLGGALLAVGLLFLAINLYGLRRALRREEVSGNA